METVATTAFFPTVAKVVDVKLVYDSTSSRWIASGTSVANSGSVLIAYSFNSSPTPLLGNWGHQQISVGVSSYTDFDCLGVDGNGIYISVAANLPHQGNHKIYAINKVSLFAGGWGFGTCWTMPNPDGTMAADVIQPVSNADNIGSGDNALFVAKADPLSGEGGRIYYRRLSWSGGSPNWLNGEDWQLLQSQTTSYINYFDLDITSSNNPTQPPYSFGGTPPAITLSRNGSRLAQASIRGGRMWLCQCVGLNTAGGTFDASANGGVIDRSGVQWLRVDLSGVATPKVNYSGRVFSNSNPHLSLVRGRGRHGKC